MRPNLPVLRSAIGPMLTETGTLKRPGEWVWDETTGTDVREYVTVFTGPCLVQPEGDVQIVDVGGASWPVRPLDVTFPYSADVEIGDLLTLTDCPGDPALVGQEIEIKDVRHDAWQVARFCLGQVAGSA